jgi:tripartite-type tricarboxylate transporter receptor subunit TctC
MLGAKPGREERMARLPRRAALIGGLAALGAIPARAQPDYPSRPVRVLIGFAAGGATDIMARLLCQRLTERMGGAPFVIENRPGAGTLLAAEAVARAAPDGYTLMYASSSTIVTPLINRSSTLDPVRDFAAVSMAQASPMILVARKDFPARTLEDVVAMAKAQPPGRLTVSHPGTGGINHLSVEMFARGVGIAFTLVPFTGNQPSLNALIRGDVDLASDSFFATRPFIEQGLIRPIAFTGPRRMAVLPEVPTFAETLPGYEVVFWSGFLAPRAAPAALLDRINAEVDAILREPEVIERLRGFGAEPVGGSRESFARAIAEDWARWGAVVREVGIAGGGG